MKIVFLPNTIMPSGISFLALILIINIADKAGN